MAAWQHNQRTKRDGTIQDPVEGAFFSNETVGNLSNALIREGVQNNLDEVKKKDRPVKARIFLSGQTYAIPSEIYRPYLNSLIPHLKADDNGIIRDNLPDFDAPMPYLLFEDFNTKGLEGNPQEFEFNATRDKNIPHNFFFFWRAYGKSGKQDGKMGSWGVGKSVFPASSKINSFWGLTIRASDNKALLMGQSVLKTHNLANAPSECGYFPYGYYGNFDSEGFAIPVEALNELIDFGNLFKLKRQISEKDTSDQTGLSVVVPFPKEEITLNTLVYSAIQQFIYPILLGVLELEITDQNKTVHLTKANIYEAIREVDWTQIASGNDDTQGYLLSLVTFIEWAINIKQEQFIELTVRNAKTAYEWRKELFDENILTHLQTDFDEGKPLAFIIPIKFQPQGKVAELRKFKAFIQKDPVLPEADNHFIREYLTITGIKSLKKKGVRGMVLISDKDLVTFLGQAEGPAHTGWHKDNLRKINYESADKCLSFVQRSLERLYAFLLKPPIGIDKDLLKDFFYVENVEDDTDNSKFTKKPGEKKKEEVDINPIQKKIRPYVLTKLNNGFKVTNNPQSNIIATDIRVKMAYERTDSKAFKKYSEYDFDVRNLTVSTNNIDIITRDKNVIQFDATDTNFELVVTGFDNRRDLIIDIK